MNAPQASTASVTGSPPVSAGVLASLGPRDEAAPLPNVAALSFPAPAPSTTNQSPVTRFAAVLDLCLPSATAAGAVLADSLRQRWEVYAAQLRACQADFSEHSVHELRVASRRLMAQFLMLGCVTPGATAEKARRVLKRRLKTLSELRDVHVQRSFVERRMARYPELLLVRDALRRQERRLEKAAVRKVKGFKTRRLEGWALGLEQHLSRQSGQPRRRDRLAPAVARATAQAFAEVVRRRRAINPANPATIHRTRIAFKKFRYMVESLSPALTGLRQRELRTLAYYQRRMGILQDLEVMQQCINSFVQKRKGLEALLQPFTGYLRRSRARALRAFLKSADQLLQFWPRGHARNGEALAVTKAAA